MNMNTAGSFNTKFGGKPFYLNPQGSTGIERLRGFGYNKETGIVTREENGRTFRERETMESIAGNIRKVPIGSRVAVSKEIRYENDPYASENLVKTGNNKFVGLGWKKTEFTLDQVKNLLGKGSYVREIEVYKTSSNH
jgi:hypothetical protein